MKGGGRGGGAESAPPQHVVPAVIHQRLLEWEVDLPAASRTSAWRWCDTGVMYLFDYCPASWHVHRWSMAVASQQLPGLISPHNAAWRTALWGTSPHSPSLFPQCFTLPSIHHKADSETSASLVGLTSQECRFSCSDWPFFFLHQGFFSSSVH